MVAYRTAASRAKEIIKELHIRYPSEICIRDIAMAQGAYVKESPLDGSEGRLVRKGRKGIITVNSRIPEAGRKRFAIAHELGHFELHSDSQLIICDEGDMYVWYDSKEQELEANDFSSNILMPEDIFKPLIKGRVPNMESIRNLAEEFRTTLTATALQYVKFSHEPCAVVICKDCHIKWYKKSGCFDFHVRVNEKLSSNTNAFGFFEDDFLPSEPDTVPADAWIAGVEDLDGWITEHSVALKTYGVVLSLLWVNEKIRTQFRRDDDFDDEPEFDMTNPFTPDGKRWRW